MSTPLFLYDERYEKLGRELHDSYVHAAPFPHTSIDNFLPPDIAEGLHAEFPAPGSIEWMRFDRHHSRKLATRGEQQFGDFTARVLSHLNGPACLKFLENLTGIEGLIPDPYYEGGGLHQIQRGGFLKMHVDFNKHSKLILDRRINLIVYLNKNWREEYNGHLELWDRDMKGAVQKILPIFNRCAIFSTTDISYHGHPEKLECPEGMTRKSVALYYYTAGRPKEEGDEAHGTIWRDRPGKVGVRGAVGSVIRSAASVLEMPGKLMRRMARGL